MLNDLKSKRDPEKTKHHRLQELALLVAIMLLATVIRCALINRQSLWLDEISSLALSTGHKLDYSQLMPDKGRPDKGRPDKEMPDKEMPDKEMSDKEMSFYGRSVQSSFLQQSLNHESSISFVKAMEACSDDVSPPLYCALLYCWTWVFGTSDLALRGLSFLFSLISVPLIFSIARRTVGGGAALFACLLFAIDPVSVHYSLEGRMYSLVWIWTLLAILACLAIRQTGSSFRTCTFFLAVATLGLWTHDFFLFPYLGCVIWLYGYGRLQPPMKYLAFLPVLFVLPHYFHVFVLNAHSSSPLPQWLDGRPRPVQLLLAPVENLCYLLGAYGQVAGPLIFTLGLVLSRIVARPAIVPRLMLLQITLFASCAGPVFADLVANKHSSLVTRYALAGLPSAVMLVAFCFFRFRPRGRLLLLLLISFLWAVVLRDDFWLHNRSGEPYKAIASYCLTGISRQDLVIVQSQMSGVLGLARYMQGDQIMAAVRPWASRDICPEELVRHSQKVLFVSYVPDKPWVSHEVKTWLQANLKVDQNQPVLSEPSQGFEVVLFDNPKARAQDVDSNRSQGI